MAISALRTSTSPHLSGIQLAFAGPSAGTRSVGTSIEVVGGDLRRVADEVTRIEREFEGVANFAVPRDPRFKAVLDVLVSSPRCERYLAILLICSPSSQIPQRQHRDR